jgi:hypothetical protein
MKQRRLVLWISLIIVILLVIMGIALFVVLQKANAPVVLPQVPAGQPAFAPQGRLVPDFPKALILDQDVALSDSYHVQYDSSLAQDTAQWNSSQSIADLTNTYQAYFSANGWQIAGVVTSTDSMAINATQASATVAVVILSQATGSRVTVTYARGL